MKAVVCNEYGGPEVLATGELPEPVPGEGEVTIDVEHAGVSFVDSLMVQNRHQNKHELPFAPGMEVAGTIRAVGQGVEGFAPGDRVAALTYDGGWAEQALASASETFPLPSTVESEVAAASLLVYLTSYLALTDVGCLDEGETLVVTGAAGGVGLAAVEIGAALGARVVACASTPEKVAIAEQRGAAVGIQYSRGGEVGQELRAALREAAPDGVDVVLDAVAGPLYEPTFRSLAWNGRYLTVGFAGGEIPKIPANLLLVKNRSARGFVLMYYRRFRHDLLQAAAEQLFAWIGEGRLDPLVSEVASFDLAPKLLRRILDREVTGKGALSVRG